VVIKSSSIAEELVRRYGIAVAIDAEAESPVVVIREGRVVVVLPEYVDPRDLVLLSKLLRGLEED